jgi:hypothetical protein
LIGVIEGLLGRKYLSLAFLWQWRSCTAANVQSWGVEAELDAAKVAGKVLSGELIAPCAAVLAVANTLILRKIVGCGAASRSPRTKGISTDSLCDDESNESNGNSSVPARISFPVNHWA